MREKEEYNMKVFKANFKFCFVLFCFVYFTTFLYCCASVDTRDVINGEKTLVVQSMNTDTTGYDYFTFHTYGFDYYNDNGSFNSLMVQLSTFCKKYRIPTIQVTERSQNSVFCVAYKVSEDTIYLFEQLKDGMFYAWTMPKETIIYSAQKIGYRSASQ